MPPSQVDLSATVSNAIKKRQLGKTNSCDGATAEQPNSEANNPTETVRKSNKAQMPRKRSGQPSKGGQSIQWIYRDCGDKMSEIQSSLAVSAIEITSAADFQLLGTYNWVLARSPTIFVPGGPPLWTPPVIPVVVKRDSKSKPKGAVKFQAAAYPFEPLFKAVKIMSPEFRFNDVHLVANRNSLRNLFRFACNQVSDSWRVDLHFINDTLFISREERNINLMVYGTPNGGYGRNFERAFTTSALGLGNSTAHHRVVQYHLGDINCVIRFEVDAYVDEDDTPFMSPQPVQSSSTKADGKATKGPTLTKVIHRGQLTASSMLAEIKTRGKDAGKSSPRHTMPQLWFGRIPHLLIGRQQDGNFIEVKHTVVSDQFQDWEAENQTALRKLVAVIHQLRDAVRTVQNSEESESVSCIAVCDKTSKPFTVKVYSPKANKPVLPEDLVRQFWSG